MGSDVWQPFKTVFKFQSKDEDAAVKRVACSPEVNFGMSRCQLWNVPKNANDWLWMSYNFNVFYWGGATPPTSEGCLKKKQPSIPCDTEGCSTLNYYCLNTLGASPLRHIIRSRNTYPTATAVLLLIIVALEPELNFQWCGLYSFFLSHA